MTRQTAIQRRNRNRKRRPNPESERSSRDALTIGEIFESAIDDVYAMGENTNFTGVVDLGVEFKSVSIDKTSGFLSVFTGNDSTQSSVQVKFATRIHIEEKVEYGWSNSEIED